VNAKKGAALLIASSALLIGATGTVQADGGPKYVTNTNILSCLNLEVLDIPILSTADNFVDCSKEVDIERNEIKADIRKGLGKDLDKD
jgi:hypothetical protein